MASATKAATITSPANFYLFLRSKSSRMPHLTMSHTTYIKNLLETPVSNTLQKSPGLFMLHWVALGNWSVYTLLSLTPPICLQSHINQSSALLTTIKMPKNSWCYWDETFLDKLWFLTSKHGSEILFCSQGDWPQAIINRHQKHNATACGLETKLNKLANSCKHIRWKRGLSCEQFISRKKTPCTFSIILNQCNDTQHPPRCYLWQSKSLWSDHNELSTF